MNEAYTTLSDPHERKWYDDHKQQILSGKVPKGSESGDEEDADYLTPGDLVPYICWTLWSDGYDISKPKNFYKVYGDLFEWLDKEEEEEEKAGTDHTAYRFGDTGTMIDDVIAFYKHWNSFSTLK